MTNTYVDIGFNSGDLEIADGESVTLTFYVYFKATYIADFDNEVLSFMVDADNHGFTADSSGSTFPAEFYLGDFNSNDFTIDVEATELRFIQQPTDVDGNTTMTPAVTVAYTDANGNIDEDVDGLGATTELTASGATLSSSTTTDGTPVEGIITFNDIKFVTAGTDVTLTVTDDNNVIDDSVTSDPFDVTGEPEISVEGLGVEIVDGDTTPDTADGTDFGDVNYQDGSTVTHTFTIKNTGNVNLELSGADIIDIYGTNDTDFTVTANPDTVIAPGESTTFEITFDPDSYDIRTASVSIVNNDSDEDDYNFNIQGNGISDEEVDWGNVQWPETGSITSGDTFNVYAQVYKQNVTEDDDNSNDGITVWIGYSTVDNDPTDPNNDADWTWVEATYNTDANDNDEYVAEIGSSLADGTYYYASRFQINGGPYKYGGFDDGFWDSTYADGGASKSGKLTVDVIDWLNLQWPHEGDITEGGNYNVYARVYEPGITDDDDNSNDNITVWIGYSTQNNDPTDPANASDWTWVEASYNTGYSSTDNDEYMADIGTTLAPGYYYYVSRAQINGGPYVYGGFDQGFWSNIYAGANPNESGKLWVKTPPEINITGYSIGIDSGDDTPDLADGTDFNHVKVDGVTTSRTFVIYNLGESDLNLTGSPLVSISGTNADDFSVTTNPDDTIGENTTTSFTITFDPSDYGLRTATVSIDNNDSDENPYTFDIQGTGADYTNCSGVDYAQDFEDTPAKPELTIALQTSHLEDSSGLSTTLYPDGENFYANGSNALYIYGDYGGTLKFDPVNTLDFNDVEFSIRTAAFAGSSSNGMDTGDYITVLVSLDGGNTFSEEVKITGYSNAKWSFDTGKGIASAAYDGDDDPLVFTPASGGYRTDDGYSTIKITHIPASENLVIKIWTSEDSDSEYWMLDDARLKLRNATTWDGSAWNNGAPVETVKMIINGDYNTADDDNVNACECEIQEGKTLTINDDTFVVVDNDIYNNGTILVENKGSLVQLNPEGINSGTGTFQLNKTANEVDEFYEYVFWSSPLKSDGFTLGDIVTDAWRYYEYDNANDQWVQLSDSDVPVAGKGYAITAPDGTDSAINITANFVKDHDPFNNGTITTPIYAIENNLVGNPYPSAIDFHKLVDENPDISGEYALWTNCADLDADGHHQDSGYTTYTVSDGDGTAVQACNDNGGYSPVAGQYIASAQGFMLVGSADGTLSFNNSQRVTGNNDNFVNRPAATNKDVVWIDILDHEGKFNQMAVGFYTGATDAYDRLYDAKNANEGNGFNLSSLLEGEKLSIQGLKKTADLNRVVPLSLENNATRNITFRIHRLEGFDNVNIYLKDNYLNTMHDLKASDYLTTVESGIFDDRFELVFTQVLDVDEQNIDPNAVLLMQNEGIFNLQAAGEHQITGVQVYDITGKLVYENNTVKQTQLSIDLSNISTGNLLLFRIQLDNEGIVVKKAIKN